MYKTPCQQVVSVITAPPLPLTLPCKWEPIPTPALCKEHRLLSFLAKSTSRLYAEKNLATTGKLVYEKLNYYCSVIPYLPVQNQQKYEKCRESKKVC